MTTTAQSIIKDAQVHLQDEAGVRWPATELVAALNDGQRELVTLRPDMFTVTAALALVAGPKQSTPVNCAELLSVPRNTSGPAIRAVERRLLDDVDPAWHTKTGVTTIQHVARESFEPNHFYVYPPAAATGASVDLIYAAWPADVATPAGAAFSTVAGNINTDDQFKNALLHFVLFRSYSKDAEFGGNAATAGAHYALFKTGSGAAVPAAA
jgi:hypothetical protein